MFDKDISRCIATPEMMVSAYFRNRNGGDTAKTKHPVILILTCSEGPENNNREGDRIAAEFNRKGFHAFILHYPGGTTARESSFIVDVFSAIASIRDHANEWNIEAERIVVCGFAGSMTLAERLMTLWKDAAILQTTGYASRQLRPDAGILIDFSNMRRQPEEQPPLNNLVEGVDGETPPAFIWCKSSGSPSGEDHVTADHLIAFAAAMLKHARPVELHVFGENARGFSLEHDRHSNQEATLSTNPWLEPALRWLGDVLFIPVLEAPLPIEREGSQVSANDFDGINRKPAQYYRNIFNDRERMFQHTPFSLEQDLVRNVINGDERAALNTIRKIYRRDDRAILAKDPLRSAKNSMICFITLLTRAVIQAGVSDEEAFALSDAAIQHIETFGDPETVLDDKDPVVIQFIHLVKTRQDRNYSVTVRKAIHYITSNLEKPFHLAAVAAYTGVHPNYLSRRFKQETGTTLSDFSTTRKIYEATYFVQHTDYSMAEIAALYGFSSQSHFGRVFKKVLFISPGDYRNRRKSFAPHSGT